MKNYLLIILFLFIACSPETSKLRNSRYNYTVDQLKAEKGVPTKTTENNLNSNYEMYHYKNEVYQVRGSQVIAKFRSPLENEKNIQYWRHFLKGIYYKIIKDNKSKSHSPNYILICKSRGLTIYFNQIGSVLRVGESMGGKGDK